MCFVERFGCKMDGANKIFCLPDQSEVMEQCRQLAGAANSAKLLPRRRVCALKSVDARKADWGYDRLRELASEPFSHQLGGETANSNK